MLIGRALLVAAVAVLAAAPARAEPGPLRVEVPEHTLQAEPRSFCWPDSDEPHPICHDGPFVSNPQHYTALDVGEMMEIGFPRDENPTLVRVQVWRPLPSDADVRQTPHGRKVTEHLLLPKASTTWQVALPPGRYVLGIGAFWDDRSAAWVVGVDVGAAGAGDMPKTAGLVAVSAAIGAAGAMVLTRARRRRVTERRSRNGRSPWGR